MTASGYILPPDSEYQLQESGALRQISAAYTNVFSEHMPELLITQNIEALLEMDKAA